MPMQMGTLMVSIRAQDFASRTLRRVAGEFAGLSREEQLFRKQRALTARQADIVGRQMDLAGHMKGLRTMERLAQRQAVFNRRLQDQFAIQDRINKLKAQPGVIGPQMRILNRDMKLASAGVNKMQNELAKLTNFVDSKMPSTFQRFRRTIQANAGRGLIDVQQEISRTARQLRRLHPELQFIKQDLDVINTAINNLRFDKLARFGHALSGVGRTMQLMGGVGVIAMGAASNAFAGFNKQVMQAATQSIQVGQGIGHVQQNAKALEETIVSLMQKFPATGEEMAASAYDIYSSMEVAFGDGLVLLKKFNQLAVASMTDLETATNAGITVLNNFGGQTQSVNEVLNLMMSTVRFGRMTMADFNTMLNKVAPAAASAGQSLADVSGAMALITTRQPSQRMSATGIARLLKLFQNPDFQEGARKASKGVVDMTDAAGQLKPLPVLINDIAGAFKEVATQKGAVELFRRLTAVGRGSGRGITDTVEAQRAWTFLFKNLAAYNRLQAKTTNNSGEFARSLKAMSESPGVRWEVFMNQLRVLALVIGEKAIPVFLKLGDLVSKGVNWFKNLSEGTRGLIVRLVTFGAIGSLLAGILLGIAGPIVAMIAHFKMWRASAAAAGTTVIRLGAALRVFSGVGIFLILEQFVGLERALRITALGFLAWKATAIAAQLAIAAYSKIAAATFKMAWRGALIATGWGIFAVAAGLAAEYVITHWEQTRKWFQNFWDELRIAAMETAIEIVGWFAWIPGKIGEPFRVAKRAMEKEIGGIRIAAHMREEVEENNRVFDQWLKTAPKKFMRQRAKFWKQLRTGIFDTGMNRESTMKALKTMQDAINRAKKGKKTDLFSTDFFKTLDKKTREDFSNYLNSLYENQKNGVTEVTDTAKQATTDILDAMRAMYDTLEQKNKELFGQLAQGPFLGGEAFTEAKEWGIQIRVKDLTRDLREQRMEWEKMRGTMAKLKTQGVPTELLDEINQAMPEPGDALAFFQKMVKDPKERAALIAEWKKRNVAIQSATKMDFKDEIARFRKAGVNMGEAIRNGFQSVMLGSWFDKWIKTTFPGIISAAVAEAKAEFARNNPPTTKPKDKTTAPAGSTKTQPGGAGTRTTANTKTTNDNSKTMTVNVNMHDARMNPHDTITHEELVRRTAFVIKNVVKGLP